MKKIALLFLVGLFFFLPQKVTAEDCFGAAQPIYGLGNCGCMENQGRCYWDGPTPSSDYTVNNGEQDCRQDLGRKQICYLKAPTPTHDASLGSPTPTSIPIQQTQTGTSLDQTVPPPESLTSMSSEDDDILNELQNRNDDKRGTYGNACWIKPIDLPIVKIPNIIPNVFDIRETIDNLIANVTKSFEGMMGKPLVSLRGGTLCGDGSIAVMYQNNTFVDDPETATNISKAILNGWDTGDWTSYETNYPDLVCKCVGRQEIIPQQLSAKNNSQGTHKLAQVQGAAIASTTETVRLIPNVCSELDNAMSRNQCIVNMCNNINSIAALQNKPEEIKKCRKCLSHNQSFISDFGSDACLTKTAASLCRSLQDGESNEELFKCVQCINKDNGIWTAIGCIYSDLQRTINEQLFGILIAIAGTSVLFCIIFAAFRMQMSSGNPEKVKAAQDMATSCITGLIMIIFSIVILRIIGVDILRLPSFLPGV